MFSTSLPLEVFKAVGKPYVAFLRFHEKPWLAVLSNHEINLALGLVAEIAKSEVAIAKIRPSFHRLEQMACDECLNSLSTPKRSHIRFGETKAE